MKPLQHLAIIMDGNGRWAKARNQPRTYGHIKGARVAKKIITACADLGIKHLTLYTFSTENWFRPAQEVSFLMRLLKRYLEKEKLNLIRKNIRFEAIGDLDKLPLQVRTEVQKAILETQVNTGLHLTFALSYGSRWEITQACKAIAQKVAEGSLKPGNIDESLINSHLFTFPNPAPDLVIRTSGEKRISNFLLWQSAYSEFAFTQTLWPDFSQDELGSILSQYYHRERRFGKVIDNENSLA